MSRQKWSAQISKYYKMIAYVKDKWKLRIANEDNEALKQPASSLGGAWLINATHRRARIRHTLPSKLHYLKCDFHLNNIYVSRYFFGVHLRVCSINGSYVNGPKRCTLLYIYSTIFMSTQQVSKVRVVHHQELIVVYCITQLCTIML